MPLTRRRVPVAASALIGALWGCRNRHLAMVPMTLRALTALVLALVLPTQGLARDAALPCVQILAPRMADAPIWTGPPLDQVDTRTIDPDVSQLVRQATDLGLDQASLGPILSTFATESPDRVTLAAAAIFVRLQDMRTATLDAIRTAAQQQRQRLDAIDQQADRLAGLAADAPDRANLVATVDWNRRQLEAGRRMMTGLCERPGRIEARFSQVAHAWDHRD